MSIEENTVVSAWLEGYMAGLISSNPPDGMTMDRADHLLTELRALQAAQEASSSSYVTAGVIALQEAKALTSATKSP
jgi:hypothetical protein